MKGHTQPLFTCFLIFVCLAISVGMLADSQFFFQQFSPNAILPLSIFIAKHSVRFFFCAECAPRPK